MEKKDYKAMPILKQKAFEDCKNVFFVDRDYNLANSKLVVPKGITIDFKGGSINNGTLSCNDNLLENLSSGCIDTRIEGTIQNDVIYSSHITSINNLALTNYSGMTINFDHDETITNSIVIHSANSSTNTSTVFDGMEHSFSCATTFFILEYSSKNVTIKNFRATAQDTAGYIDFEKMNSSVGVTNIVVKDNIISRFSVGISINGDDDGYQVTNCRVEGNTIGNAVGTDSGHGYGIHLANARNCVITRNHISSCERHSIYHAYGQNNEISHNTIVSHRVNQTSDLSTRAALEIVRKSTDISVSHNSFYNSYNVSILVYAFPHSFDDSSASNFSDKYGCCERITITGNDFYSTNFTNNLGGLPAIRLGYIYDPSIIHYSQFATCHVKDVVISANTFKRINSAAIKCISIDQCLHPLILNNTFEFDAQVTSSSSDLIEIHPQFKNDENMQVSILSNTFKATGYIPQNSIFCLGNLANVNNSLFNITFTSNSFVNQSTSSGTHLNFRQYKPVGITSSAGTNLHLQAEVI